MAVVTFVENWEFWRSYFSAADEGFKDNRHEKNILGTSQKFLVFKFKQHSI